MNEPEQGTPEPQGEPEDDSCRYWEYARERLHELLDLIDAGSDTEVLSAGELLLMALAMAYGSSAPITLNPADIDEVMSAEAAAGVCTCPPALLARGGYRGGCPVHSLS